MIGAYYNYQEIHGIYEQPTLIGRLSVCVGDSQLWLCIWLVFVLSCPPWLRGFSVGPQLTGVLLLAARAHPVNRCLPWSSVLCFVVANLCIRSTGLDHVSVAPWDGVSVLQIHMCFLGFEVGVLAGFSIASVSRFWQFQFIPLSFGDFCSI